MNATTNRFTPQDIAVVSEHFGKLLAAGECSRIDFGIKLFEIAATGAKVDGKAEYVRFAEAAIAADNRKALRIDLSNKKAVAQRATELNAFINLAARNVSKRETLFARVIAHVDGMDVKPVLSMWNCLVKVAATQVEKADYNLTDADIASLLPPRETAKAKGRVANLESVVDLLDKHAKRFEGGDKDIADAKAALETIVARLKLEIMGEPAEEFVTLAEAAKL